MTSGQVPDFFLTVIFKLCSEILLAGLLLFISYRAAAANSFPKVALEPVFTNFKIDRPVWLEEFPDDSKRVVVLQQAGRIHLLNKSKPDAPAEIFLDISDRKPYVDNEEGLLGFAFHPKFRKNHKFYIYYTRQNPRRSVISELEISKSSPDRADLATERIIMIVPQPYSNHNGGALVFGRDNYLYVSLGDGGSLYDPHNNAQNLSTLLGKILRIDIDRRSHDLQYGIPEDNPFVKTPEARPEIFSYGMRNPWRISFDRETGDLWAADVGQDKWEEVDLIVKGGNYGWSKREGFHPLLKPGATTPPEPEKGDHFIDPVIEYPHNAGLASECRFPLHSPGTSITGGYVYRGNKLPNLWGVYLYADFTLGTIWGLRSERGNVTE